MLRAHRRRETRVRASTREFDVSYRQAAIGGTLLLGAVAAKAIYDNILSDEPASPRAHTETRVHPEPAGGPVLPVFANVSDARVVVGAAPVRDPEVGVPVVRAGVSVATSCCSPCLRQQRMWRCPWPWPRRATCWRPCRR